MYDLKPKAVYAHERVFANPRAVARMERMLDALGIDLADVPVVNADHIDEIIDAAGVRDHEATQHVVRGGHGRYRQGIHKHAHDPVLIFNTFVWDPAERVEVDREFVNPRAARFARFFAGVGDDFAFSRRDLGTPHANYVCQGGWGIHTIDGCMHKCDYCSYGFLVNVMLDLEDFCDVLTRHFAEHPAQKLYRYDLFSDILAFEPEYGCCEVVGECFSRTEDKHVLLYTRSANVQHLVDLPYKEHSPINWTLSMETQCRVIERDSPTLDERIEAMRICQEAGYAVRAGFSPIIPIANWREETTDMLERLFATVHPEVLRCWVLSMMEPYEFENMFDLDAMDPWAVRRMREDAEQMAGRHDAPFPTDVRAAIYEHYLSECRRISPHTPVALCTEQTEIWDLLEDQTLMDRDHMFCCCGGLSVPGGWSNGNAPR